MPGRDLTISTGLGPFSQIATWVAREVKLWRWRRELSQIGAPVTLQRRRSGRAFAFETRRSDGGI